MEDPASLDAALKGVYGVFSVQNFWLPEVGFEGEIREGKTWRTPLKPLESSICL